MDSSGYVYVPAACAQKQACKLVVAFHGCEQSASSVGTQYVSNAGYNMWADTNNLIVLYPQAISSETNPSNPDGCWDWWGYNSGNQVSYDEPLGAQMSMIKKMIDFIGQGYAPLPPPTNVTSDMATDNSIDLIWNVDAGAATYNIYRGGGKVGSASTTQYLDTGLLSGSQYTYTITAVTSSGAESAPSTPIVVSTSGNPPPLQPPTGLTATNATGSTISLAWNAAAGATGYYVYRNGQKVNSAPITTTSYTDSNLAASTTYQYQATATNGVSESAPSNTVSASTTNGWQCKQFTDNNYNQVAAGRATEKGGYCYAVGSGQAMGLYNVATFSTLAETSNNYYIVGTCPN
jgi:hypothetical protein